MTLLTGTVLGAIAVLAGGEAAFAQQILEIDLGSGRDVINDEWRAIRPGGRFLVDHERGLLYAVDLEHPDDVMGFSLLTGEPDRLVRIPKGEGPRELPSTVRAVSQASAGGLYVLGDGRVLHLDSLGQVVEDFWRPVVPGGGSAVCDLGGSPAVPSWGGVVRKGRSGDEILGAGVVQGEALPFHGTVQEIVAKVTSRPTSMFCIGESAYTVAAFEDAADTVFSYSLNGGEGKILPPSEFAEGRVPWNRKLRLAGDGHGNLVLVRDMALEVAGAVIDPGSGCYAVIRINDPNPTISFGGIVEDSALVLYKDYEDTVRNGRPTRTVLYTSGLVKLHPIRRISGEACPGMFPSLTSESQRSEHENDPAPGAGTDPTETDIVVRERRRPS